MAPTNPFTAVSSVAQDARSWLDRIWSSVADSGRRFADVPAKSVPPLDRAERLAQSLLSERGEASGAAVSRELHDSLRSLTPEDREAFLRFLSERFGPDPEELQGAASRYLADPSPEHTMALTEIAEPPRQELLRRMNMSPGGTAALVALRREVLGLLRGRPELKPLDADMRHLLTSWFNRGFLELRRIDWQTPAAVLEKLIDYEAVHEIQGWDDLRRRLAPDRRCFGFFHPALPGEPLIFVEVALTEGLATAVQPLLVHGKGGEDAARAAAAKADTAIFYSISNCQEGLRGISFGNFLIKQVVEELKAELPRLTRFATLSPVPGLRRALERKWGGRRRGPGRAAGAGARGAGSRPGRRRGPGSHVPRGRRAAARGHGGRLVAGRRPRRGAAPGVAAALRGIPDQAEPARRPDRPGGTLPPGQRRAAGAGELAGQHLHTRHGGVVWDDGELSIRPRQHRGEPRSLRPQRKGGPLHRGGCAAGAAAAHPGRRLQAAQGQRQCAVCGKGSEGCGGHAGGGEGGRELGGGGGCCPGARRCTALESCYPFRGGSITRSCRSLHCQRRSPRSASSVNVYAPARPDRSSITSKPLRARVGLTK